MIRRRELAAVSVVALAFAAGPTVGDVGSCGKTATALDEAAFASRKKSVDCQRCNDCGLQTQTCLRACDPRAPSEVYFPPTCYPLAHDGDVCLHALEAASCSAYAGYVDDNAPTQPSECEFCRLIPDSGGSE